MTQMTLSQGFALGIAEEMRRDPTVFVVGTDLLRRGGHWAQVRGLGEQFGPERIRDAPISEAAMMATGVGAALNGMRPIVDLNFADFVFGAIDELVNQAAKVRYMWGAPVPLVVRGTNGVAGGAAQHNNGVEAWFAHVPGLVVVMPATAGDAKGLIKTALRGEDPVVFLMHKLLTGRRGEVGGEDELVPFGQAAVRREGADVTVVCWSAMVHRALDAAERLAGDGIDCEVVDVRTLFPLDIETIAASARKTGRIVVADEAPRFAGAGAEIAALVQERCFDWLDAPVLRVGAPRVPIAHSPVLWQHVVPDAAAIAAAVGSITDGRSPMEERAMVGS